MISMLGPSNTVLRGGDDPRRGRGKFEGNVPDKPNTPMNCELDWSMQRRTHDRSRRLIASVGRVYCRPRRGYCTSRAKSDIYDCRVRFASCVNAVVLVYCGCGRSNLARNSFTLLDAGYRAAARNQPPDVVHAQCELASILHVSKIEVG